MNPLQRLFSPILASILMTALPGGLRAESLRFFIGTYTGGGSEGIYTATLDTETGALGEPRLAAKTENPSFLAIHPTGSFLFAANEIREFKGRPTGAISAFKVNRESGTLTLLNQESSGGAGPCHLVVDDSGRHVLAANYGGGSVVCLPVTRDGRLVTASGFIQHEGSSVNPKRQKEPHAHSINLSADNRFAVAADLGTDQLFVYQFFSRHGSFAPADPPFARLRPGAGPRHFAFHPSNRFAYVINELHSTLTAWSWDADTGGLQEIQTISTLPVGHQGGNNTAEVRVHPSGRFVYGSNRGHDSIAVFRVNGDSGRLEPVEIEPTRGKTPRNFNLDPSGRWLLVANQGSGNICVFRVDPVTGALDYTGNEIQVAKPVCIRFAIQPAKP